MNTKPMTAAVCGFLLFIAASTVLADQRALLVGVGKHLNSKNDLPGIDLDLDRMTDTLKVMGFKSEEIRTLLDQESTAENILHEMNTWLVDGVGENDRVVFYFSGHGSFIPDEDGDETEDGADEVLIAHDMQVVRRDGRATLVGVVTDDQINEAIQQSPSRNYLTIVDACHSGTATRNILLSNRSLTGDEVHEKSFVYEDMPVGFDTSSFDRDVSTAGDGAASSGDSFISISAAGDGEKAIGGSRGGLFTIGFSEAIFTAAKSNTHISLSWARDAAEEFIHRRLDPKRAHTPQITGNLALADKILGTGQLAGGNGPMWQRLEQLVGEGQYFPLGTSSPSYIVDETITLMLDIKEPGYLNLISVDSEDTATVLFPNVVDDNNFVEAGRFEFPTENSGFDFVAAEPLGPTLVLAFVSENPINFRDFGYDGRLPSGDFDPAAVFTNVTHSAARAIKIRIKQEGPEAGAESPAATSSPDVDVAAPPSVTVDVPAAGDVESPPDEPEIPEVDPNEPDSPWLYASSLEVNVRKE